MSPRWNILSVIAASAVVMLMISATAGTVVAAPQAGVSASTVEQTLAPGDTFDVTYEFSNTGAEQASAGRIELTTPERISPEEISGDGVSGIDSTIPTVWYGFSGPIDTGETKVTTVTFKLAPDAPEGEYSIGAEASVIGNSKSVETSTNFEVAPTSALALSSSPPTVRSRVDDEFTITYRYTNNHDSSGTAGAIKIEPSPGITPVTISGDGESGLGGEEPYIFYGLSGPIASGTTLVTNVTYRTESVAATGKGKITATSFIRGFNASDQTVTSVSLTSSVIEEYDTNGEPGIQIEEVLAAITEFNNEGGLGIRDVLLIIEEYNK